MSYELDHAFLGKPHHQLPRRVYAAQGCDWQYRVDYERLRKERLAKAREQMEIHDLGALVLYAGANIRYITGSYQGNWKYNINIRYAVLPRGGDPVLFETAGSDMQCARIDLPWLHKTRGSNIAEGLKGSASIAAGAKEHKIDPLTDPGLMMRDNIRPAMTWQWAESAVPYMAERMVASIYEVLKEHGVEKEKIGIDNLDMPSLDAFQKFKINIVNGWPAMSAARVVKTIDEIELLKQSSTIGDAAMWHIKHEWLKPGITERQIEAKVHELMLRLGCEIIYDIIVASGGNTSPYRRWATDKIIRQGDLVIVDINAVGPSGMFIDYVRCFKCAAKMTQKEIDLYKQTYDSMYAGIEMLKPGNSTADVASKFPEYDDDTYGTVTLQQFAHSIGITLYEGMWISRAYSLSQPAEIKENMYFAIETFAGHPLLEQTTRLEENVLVGPNGPIIFTLMEHMEEAVGDHVRPGGVNHPSLEK
ncbi:MAG: aminopeptidase P family protein [Rhodoplanes sp.]|uniref:M24 family metallopeptidase n=1 Tax=Rhodoplanes sp. TaxID=1968906 RepID=UPI0017D3DCC1|nr:M24 family metallopeptidase [Rhodoplanes sp.]NVO15972.1 aminopeptidase P family protein [Rhodoplanes sp.]